MVGEESLILIDTKTVSSLQIAGVIVVWLGVSEAALVLAHADLAGTPLVVEVISRLFLAAFPTSLCFHEFATSGGL
jgi:hypothetical protein